MMEVNEEKIEPEISKLAVIQDVSDELDLKAKKYLRGDGANLEVLQDKKLKGQLAVREKLYGQSAKAAAKAEKWLMPCEEGYLEGEGSEKTWRIKQEDILKEVDFNSSRKPFDMILPELGPYTLGYTTNGRYMMVGGRKGHLAMIDMISMDLIKEFQVRETVRDVVFLQNEQFFAVAQKKYPYIYNRHGTEIHCLKDSWVANPYETKKQRREKEVHSLLDKLQPETIMLDPRKIGTVKPPRPREKPSRKEVEGEMEEAIEGAKSKRFKNKTKGRSKASKIARKKEVEVFRAKRPFLDQQAQGVQPTKQRRVAEESGQLPKSLQRFARKKAV